MLELHGTLFNADYQDWKSDQILSTVKHYTLEQRANIDEMWADNNWMDTIPGELFVLLPNIRVLAVENNVIRTLPVGIYSWTKLNGLYLRDNHLQRLPSTMTRLTELRTLFLRGNAALPPELQENTQGYDDTQALIQAISEHYGAIEAACRKTIVTLLGVRKFRPIPAFAFIGRDVMAIIGRMMWNDCVSGEWSQ